MTKIQIFREITILGTSTSSTIAQDVEISKQNISTNVSNYIKKVTPMHSRLVQLIMKSYFMYRLLVSSELPSWHRSIQHAEWKRFYAFEQKCVSSFRFFSCTDTERASSRSHKQYDRTDMLFLHVSAVELMIMFLTACISVPTVRRYPGNCGGSTSFARYIPQRTLVRNFETFSEKLRKNCYLHFNASNKVDAKLVGVIEVLG